MLILATFGKWCRSSLALPSTMDWRNSLSLCPPDKLQEQQQPQQEEEEEQGLTNFLTLLARGSSLSPLEI
jgi:hypothetical protein